MESGRRPGAGSRRVPLPWAAAAAAAPVTLLLLLLAARGTEAAAPRQDTFSAKAATVAAGGSKGRLHIVRLRYPAVASYTGGIEDYAATAAAAGGRLNYRSAHARRYRGFLRARAAQVAAAAGAAGAVRYSYGWSFAGAALAGLSEAQVQALRADPSVVSVYEDKIYPLLTYTSPKFLNLMTDASGLGGVWAQQLGTAIDGTSRAGENVVIGMLDSGIWPESLAFTANKGRPYTLKAGTFNGTCFAAPDLPTCSRKVVGCRIYPEGMGGADTILTDHPNEYISCRDGIGHGTHTASTAAGELGYTGKFGEVTSGIAPRARIAVYKVCWDSDLGGCAASDTVAAVDDAIADGVDILSYSVGGETSTYADPVSQAFLAAARAGIFVVAAAGNSGPGAGTVNHPAPWVTTVAASTQARQLLATLRLSNGQQFEGAASSEAGVGTAPIVLATAVAKQLVDLSMAQLCAKNTLDPLKAAGKIVVCDRGDIPRVDKSAEVLRAKGLGMVLLNTLPTVDSLEPDAHSVPTVHLRFAARDAVRAAAAADGASASLSGAYVAFGSQAAPEMGDFSSRGPSLAGDGAVLKPDMTAPGVAIYAAVAPPSNGGAQYDYISGTSMAVPHVAGLAALLKQKHLRWSPMAIKSALMTTAYTTNVAGPSPGQPFGGPFDYGSGHVDPTRMFNPGLIFDTDYDQWVQFLCGTERSAVPDAATACAACDATPSLCKPYNLNLPSLALNDLTAGVRLSVPRRVRSVLATTATFTTAVATSGLSISVTPDTFTLDPGQARRVVVNVMALQGSNGSDWLSGSITWTSDQGTVTRMPVVADADILDYTTTAPLLRTDTSYAARVTAGFTGTLLAASRGLSLAAVYRATVLQSGSVSFNVSVPPAARLVRLRLYEADLPPGSGCDLDLTVYDATKKFGAQVDYSQGHTSDEVIDMVAPAAGIYRVAVDGYIVPPLRGVRFALHVWVIGADPAMQMPVSPPSRDVATGGRYTFTITMPAGIGGTGAPDAPPPRYLGAVDYSRVDTGEQLGRTLLTMD